MTPNLPNFVEVDLAKTTKHGSDDVYPGPFYLALIGDYYYLGKFSKVWFGLNFSSGQNSFQYDPPGTNSSRFHRLWKFDNAEAIVNQQYMWQELTT